MRNLRSAVVSTLLWNKHCNGSALWLCSVAQAFQGPLLHSVVQPNIGLRQTLKGSQVAPRMRLVSFCCKNHDLWQHPFLTHSARSWTQRTFTVRFRQVRPRLLRPYPQMTHCPSTTCTKTELVRRSTAILLTKRSPVSTRETCELDQPLDHEIYLLSLCRWSMTWQFRNLKQQFIFINSLRNRTFRKISHKFLQFVCDQKSQHLWAYRNSN